MGGGIRNAVTAAFIGSTGAAEAPSSKKRTFLAVYIDLVSFPASASQARSDPSCPCSLDSVNM